MIREGQRSFRSQIAYVNLVAVLIVCALIIVVWNSQLAAVVFAVLGVVWTGLTLRSGIELTDDGFRVRGMLRTRCLSWADTDAFIVVGFSGSSRRVLRTAVDYAAPTPGGPELVGLSISAIEAEAIAMRVPLFSVVAAVTSQGKRLRVHGTASTPLDPEFPADAAAELNRALTQHNPAATTTTS
ncbi:MAG: hypothetical protein ACRDLT_05930 [Solirubrobacteraceae bacterium]